MKSFLALFILILASATVVFGQSRQPSTTTKPYVIKSGKQVSDIYRTLEKQEGNKQEDVIAASGNQMRVAIFHDEKRENDRFEVHDASDDIYYVLEGNATLQLGGSLVNPTEISPGEWRSEKASGTTSVAIKKGDLIVVHRGTVHHRTVTGKGFSMILIKVFAENVNP